MIIVLMGVCGSGKTTVGQTLARKLRWSFADADEFHSEKNKLKMSSGQPLTDQWTQFQGATSSRGANKKSCNMKLFLEKMQDRLPWLQNIHSYIRWQQLQQIMRITCGTLLQELKQNRTDQILCHKMTEGRSAVVTCSALKKYYRKILLHGDKTPPDSDTESHNSVPESGDRQASHDQISHGQENESCSPTKGNNDTSKCLEQSSKHSEVSLSPFTLQDCEDSQTKHDQEKLEKESVAKDKPLINIEKSDINLQISDTKQASLRCSADKITFVLLNGLYSTLEKRLSCRQGHFMPGSLLRSQMETLETPGIDENCIIVDVDATVEEIVSEIMTKLKLQSS